MKKEEHFNCIGDKEEWNMFLGFQGKFYSNGDPGNEPERYPCYVGNERFLVTQEGIRYIFLYKDTGDRLAAESDHASTITMWELFDMLEKEMGISTKPAKKKSRYPHKPGYKCSSCGNRPTTVEHTILSLPIELCKKLREYANENNITLSSVVEAGIKNILKTP